MLESVFVLILFPFFFLEGGGGGGEGGVRGGVGPSNFCYYTFFSKGLRYPIF